MSIRQWIGYHGRLTGAIAVAVVMVAILFAAPRRPEMKIVSRPAPDQAFCSDDDGATYFLDSAAKPPPFDHNGRIAYGAVVVRCADGKPFVAFLQKYDPSEIASLEQQMRQSPTPNLVRADPGVRPEVKKPGETRWVSFRNDPRGYARVTTPVCPEGGALISVLPDDPDSGASK